MTHEKDKAPLGPVLAMMSIVEPGRWVAVHTIDRPPADSAGLSGEGRMVVEIFHDNDDPIELGVYEDGAVRFEGSTADYPANGWRSRIMPFEDSLYQTTDRGDRSADALAGHPREAPATVVRMDNPQG